jgi:HK97 gp10 family phage protein
VAEVRGLQELLANLDELGVTVRSACRGAVNAASQEVKRAAIANARAQGLVSTGALVNNIAVKRERGTPATITEYHIGVRHGKEAKGAQKIAVRGADGRIRFEYTDNPFYWHMWEFGHYNVFLRRHVAARAFMRPAMLAREDGLLEIMRAYLAARIERTQNRILAV